VVWFDPELLRLDVQETVGLTQQKLLVADEAGIRSETGIRAHAEWQEWRSRVRLDGAAPSLNVKTATEFAIEEANRAPEAGRRVEPKGQAGVDGGLGLSWRGIPVSIERAAQAVDRPHGKRFGILVHAVLSAILFNAGREEVAEVAELQGRIYGASANEVSAAVEVVMGALSHPVMRRAAAADARGELRREVAVALRVPAESSEGNPSIGDKGGRLSGGESGQLSGGDRSLLIEGVIDLAFLDGDGGDEWTVVDFKTDYEIGGRLEEYRRQVQLYAAAVVRSTGLRARAVLLRV
jgi:hypothetical protein